jgi:hypothetical protein
LQVVRRFRIPALLCALAVVLCELIARPYANMGICDDGPYIAMAHTLATTGHIAYNGWPAAMLGWQLYLGAAFIKLFGFSFTVVRSSTILVAMIMAFVIQRTLVRVSITERNATIGTLALVLSPLYLLLSATYMSDIFGLFAVIICLYCCLRALSASSAQRTILWICSAVSTNAILGTCRQIGWLGILALVPATLWLLRSRRRVLLVGTVVNFAGVAFVVACLKWFARQPYIQPEHLIPSSSLPVAVVFINIAHAYLYVPFLLLPVIAVCLSGVWKNRRAASVVALISLAYVGLSIKRGYFLLLQPPMGDWVTVWGYVREVGVNGDVPILLTTWVRVLITAGSLGGLLGLALSSLHARQKSPKANLSKPSWRQLNTLFLTFTLIYTVLLIPRAATVGLSDRYVLELVVPALFCLLRFYQENFRSRLPLPAMLLVGVMAVYGIITTHNTFAFYRARVALAAELRANGVPDLSVDHGWEYNFNVELQHAPSLNDFRIVTPANFYVPTPPLPDGPCYMFWSDSTPHIHALYAISFQPGACYGPTRFAPVHYSRWPYQTPGALYAVRFTPSAKP